MPVASTVGVGISMQLCATVNGGGTYAPMGNVAFVLNGTTVAIQNLDTTSVAKTNPLHCQKISSCTFYHPIHLS
jgi:hypothetical protein